MKCLFDTTNNSGNNSRTRKKAKHLSICRDMPTICHLILNFSPLWPTMYS